MRRRRRQPTSQYRPPLVKDGPVSFSPSPATSTKSGGGSSGSRRPRVLYRPASPPAHSGPSASGRDREKDSRGRKHFSTIISSSNGDGAYLTGPITFPPRDASPDEIMRWFLNQQGQNSTNGANDASSASNDDDGEDAKISHQSPPQPQEKPAEMEEWERMRRLEAQRRARNRYLSSQIESGGARIDADGRIVPTTIADDDDEAAEGVGPAVEDSDEDEENGGSNNDTNHGDNWDGVDDARFAPSAGLRNNIGPGRRMHGVHATSGHQEGYAMPNTDEGNLEFIPAPGAVAVASADGNGNRRNNTPRSRWRRGEGRQQQQQPEQPDAANVAQPPPSLTFRRICFAVFAVVTAFVCIMLQTLPLLESARTIDPVLDPVLKEILVLRDMTDHLSSCGDLRRDRPTFGFSHLLSSSGNDASKGSDEVKREVDGADPGTTTFLNNRRVLASSHRFPHLREAWTSILALSGYVLAIIQDFAMNPFIPASERKKLDCQEGVVHIPSVAILKERYEEALVRDRAWQYPNEWPDLQEMTVVEKKEASQIKEMYAPYKDGVDVAWSLPCAGGGGTGDQKVNDRHRHEENSSSVCQLAAATAEEGSWRPTLIQRLKRKIPSKNALPSNGTCSVESISDSKPICFRGISDGIITDNEVDAALRLASDLIANGGDHLQIRRDAQILRRYLPTVIAKIDNQFRERYGVSCRLEPVAFRIFASLPMEGEPLSAPLAGSIHSKYTVTKRRAQFVGAVNHTVYHEWEAENRERNDQAPFHLLRQLRTFSQRKRPFRDPCVLMSDRQRSPDFSYHSSVFLSDGAGSDHSGGTELYVDAHRRNRNPRRRIRRGIVIDASRGRMVLSSGGNENKRCKMPMRTGIRAVLQIWWGCR